MVYWRTDQVCSVHVDYVQCDLNVIFFIKTSVMMKHHSIRITLSRGGGGYKNSLMPSLSDNHPNINTTVLDTKRTLEQPYFSLLSWVPTVCSFRYGLLYIFFWRGGGLRLVWCNCIHLLICTIFNKSDHISRRNSTAAWQCSSRKIHLVTQFRLSSQDWVKKLPVLGHHQLTLHEW